MPDPNAPDPNAPDPNAPDPNAPDPSTSDPNASGGAAAPEIYFWVVANRKKEEIEVWTTQEKAEESLDKSSAPAEDRLLYHVAESELNRAFPNRPVVGGDRETDTRNKYIRKGWNPGQK